MCENTRSLYNSGVLKKEIPVGRLQIKCDMKRCRREKMF